MTVTAYWYSQGIIKAFNKEVDWESDTLKVALCNSSYTPNQDTHDYFDDITNELSTGSGYTAGGATMSGGSVTYTAGTNVIKFDGDNVAWASSTLTARYAIVYASTGNPATSSLLCYVDFGENLSSTSGAFQITWNADGVAKATVS